MSISYVLSINLESLNDDCAIVKEIHATSFEPVIKTKVG